jgi:hypothetical protein
MFLLGQELDSLLTEWQRTACTTYRGYMRGGYGKPDPFLQNRIVHMLGIELGRIKYLFESL